MPRDQACEDVFDSSQKVSERFAFDRGLHGTYCVIYKHNPVNLRPVDLDGNLYIVWRRDNRYEKRIAVVGSPFQKRSVFYSFADRFVFVSILLWQPFLRALRHFEHKTILEILVVAFAVHLFAAMRALKYKCARFTSASCHYFLSCLTLFPAATQASIMSSYSGTKRIGLQCGILFPKLPPDGSWLVPWKCFLPQ